MVNFLFFTFQRLSKFNLSFLNMTLWLTNTLAKDMFLQNLHIFFRSFQAYSPFHEENLFCTWLKIVLKLIPLLREYGTEILKRTVRKWKRIYIHFVQEAIFNIAPYHKNNKTLCKLSFDSIRIITFSVSGKLQYIFTFCINILAWQ